MPAGGNPRRAGQDRLTAWLIAFFLFAITLAAAVRVILLVQQARQDSPGTTSDPASYGFNLATLSLPAEGLVVRRPPGEFQPQRYSELLSPALIAEKNRREHGKTLVSSDRVIGVLLDGEARAYPLRFLNWHEVCNDDLAEHRIAVSYCGLSDAATVFSLDDLARAEGMVTNQPSGLIASGLLYNSNTLLTEQWLQPAQANLWRQLDGLAIAGPRAGERLPRLPLTLCEWRDWLRLYPDSTVAGPDPLRANEYKSNPYGAYFQSERLDFPVYPPVRQWQGEHGEWLKSRCLILEWQGRDYFYPYEWLGEGEVRDGAHYERLSLNGHDLALAWRPADVGFSQPTAWMEPADGSASGLRCVGSALLFACQSALGDSAIAPPELLPVSRE